MFRPGIYLLSDSELMPWEQFIDLIPSLIEAGVSMVQLRNKQASTRVLIAQTEALLVRAEGRVPVIVNDRVDVALAAGADGVHVGKEDMPVSTARNLLGSSAILGVSLERDQPPQACGATYLAASPVFETSTKADTSEPFGLDGFTKLAQVCSMPLAAIGGIHHENAEALVEQGADSLAVISAILGAKDPVSATQDLHRAFLRGLEKRA